jgi:TPR repeat protein
MNKRFGAVLAAYVLALMIGAMHSRVAAQSADEVLCDRVAADPDDPDKPKDAKGVGAIAPGDVAIAIKFCRVAAGKSRRAMYQLGRAYAAGQQLPEAAAAYRKAADKGSTSAMVELGVMMANGAGVAKNADEAHKLFERAAAAGNPRGVTSLAALSGSGGVPLDPVKERSMLARAAEANSPEAEYQLGLMYANGAGGPQDDAAARAMFEKAAAQNHPDALLWMGAFTQTGRGGPKDATAAKSYYERAAALGSEDAKVALKRMECPYVIKDKRGNQVTNLCF